MAQNQRKYDPLGCLFCFLGDCLVSKRMFIPDGTPVLVTEYYILTRRNIETLNMVVCSATNVESCLCRKAPREFLKVKPLL